MLYICASDCSRSLKPSRNRTDRLSRDQGHSYFFTDLIVVSTLSLYVNIIQATLLDQSNFKIIMLIYASPV